MCRHSRRARAHAKKSLLQIRLRDQYNSNFKTSILKVQARILYDPQSFVPGSIPVVPMGSQFVLVPCTVTHSSADGYSVCLCLDPHYHTGIQIVRDMRTREVAEGKPWLTETINHALFKPHARASGIVLKPAKLPHVLRASLRSVLVQLHLSMFYQVVFMRQ